MTPRFGPIALVVAPWMVVCVAGLSAQPASAHKRFARKEGVECKECHVNPEGGGPRSVVGQYYQATEELPLDRSPETLKRMKDTVDRWLYEVMARPPPIMWPYKPLAEKPAEPPKPIEQASTLEVARRISLDLRNTMPTPEEVTALQDGRLTLESYVDRILETKDFQSTWQLFHRDLIRPRTGDYNADASLTLVQELTVDGTRVYTSTRVRGEQGGGACSREKRVKVSPWWDRQNEHYACADTASTAATAVVDGQTLRCDTMEGQQSGKCGCGPYMVFCYAGGLKDQVIASMRYESARVAMEIINNDLPYSEVLTADWTILDGALELFYARLDGRLLELTDPDIKKPPQRVMRDARHSGVLSSPMLLNFFYNGRRWSQRVFESYFCHDVFPDYDLLDDTRDRGVMAIPYRDSPLLEPSLTVAESRPCAACHLQLDGLSRVKDRWDPFGVYYEKSGNGHVIPQKAIFLGQEVDGLDGFGRVLGASEVFHDCVVTQAWEQLTGHRFRPDEHATRTALVKRFEETSLNYKDMLRAVLRTPEYRSKSNVKTMTKEMYARAMGRATDVAWKIGEKPGWDSFYDKIGGMDYRKIEMRDKSPGTGHSLVQMKGAQESCGLLIERDVGKDSKKGRLVLKVDDPVKSPSDKELDEVLAALYVRAYARPLDAASAEERALLTGLFRSIERKSGSADGYKAMCTAVFGSSDFALF